MASIVIAAHNEATVLGRTLDALLADAAVPTTEIVVVANGCTDDTAAIARLRGVRVLEVPGAGKAAALNAGDAAVTAFPRIYLDADIVVPPGAVRALIDALETPGALAAVPGRRLVVTGRPWPVRAYTAVQRRLPVFADALFGRGLVALSAAGRARFDTFPLVVADDLFLDSLFTASERVAVPTVEVAVETPPTTRALFRRLVRVRRGNAALRSTADPTLRVRPADRWSWLRDVVAHDVRLLPAGIVYAGLSAAAALTARRGPRSSLAWGRDSSTRPRGGVMRIGIMGVQCDTANMGLAALSYGAVRLVDGLVPGDADIVLFSINSRAELDRMASTLGTTGKRFTAVPFRRKDPRGWLRSARELSRCAVVLDFTGGDSFSDIYGLKRLVKKLADKELALRSGAPLVLAPQTIGPFKRRLTLPWVKHVLNRAALVATRDELSRDFLAGLLDREVLVATDVAVALPWDPQHYELPTQDRPRVGFNVSGLLWNGGYTGRNQFNLTTDYRAFCRGVIEGLLADGTEVHLVPHVLSRGDASDEDDVATSRELLAEYPECVLAPGFESPVEAKSYISRMDALIGSRMHATIASFTSGVATVPVAYSRKFAGFFQNLGYPALVDLVATETRPAIEQTLALVRNPEALGADVAAGNARARERLEDFTGRLGSLLAG